MQALVLSASDCSCSGIKMPPEHPLSSTPKNNRSKPKLPQALSAANGQHQAEAALADDLGNAQLAPPQVRAASREPPLPIRLLTKPEVLRVAGGVSYVTLWSWMRAGAFPRPRVVGGKSMWRSDEVRAWLDALPVRPLKGDDEVPAHAPGADDAGPRDCKFRSRQTSPPSFAQPVERNRGGRGRSRDREGRRA
jgi:predicted DNA-binding transcriptional regulator AlpA